jgi:hypothetical protein
MQRGHVNYIKNLMIVSSRLGNLYQRFGRAQRAVLDKRAVAIPAINPVPPVERIINERVTQRTAAAVAGHFIGGIVDRNDFWGRGGYIGHYGKSRELYVYEYFIDLKQGKTKRARVFTPYKGHAMTEFFDNPSIKGREEKFLCRDIAIAPVLASWKESLFAHEWLKPDGTLKNLSELNDTNRQKRMDIEAALKEGKALPKPVLGLGITDSVEIGSGKDVLLTLASMAQPTVPVHIPKSHADDFKLFLR